MKFDYELLGHGWAKATIYGKNCSATMTASYISDALGNLAWGILSVLEGKSEVVVSFDEEPGEFRWVFRKLEGSEYDLEILKFDETWGNQPHSEGEILFKEKAPSGDYGKMILKTLQGIYHNMGRKRYRRAWVLYPFPTKALIEIKERLKQMNGCEGKSE